MKTLLSTFSLCLIASFLIACQGQEPTPTDSTTAAETTPEAAPSEPEAVTYEPAYPEEVSAEGLDQDDTDQQEAAHDHGEDSHTHGEDSHSHGGDSHSHGEDTHAHAEGEGHDSQQH